VSIDLKVGDLVKFRPYDDDLNDLRSVGIVMEVGYDMWGEEEDETTGVKVLWQDSMAIEYVFNDELIKLSEGHKK